MPIRFPKDGNPCWPLPKDYEELGAHGQRLARLNAVTLQETPDDFVAAWSFFRSYYLFPTPPGQFYGLGGVKPSPLTHYLFVRDIASYPMNAWGAPRSFAKSIVLGTEVPLMLTLTRKNFSTALILNKLGLVTQRFDKFMVQIEENPRILEDFGKLRPARGSGMWNHSAIKLVNGSSIYGYPVEGQLLGPRPPLILLDDVEYDPALIHQPADKSERMEYLLTVVILPMREEGTCVGIIGTTHRRDFYLHHVLRSDDPSYTGWNRRFVTVYNTDGSLIWPEKLSEEFLSEQRLIMKNDSAWRAAYLGEPGSDADRILMIHPKLNQYEVLGDLSDNPLVSDAVMKSYRKTKLDERTGEPVAEVEQRPFGPTVSKMYRIATLDYAYTRTARSDFCAIPILGFENSDSYRDVMWVLDLWMGKVTDDALINMLWSMSIKWGVHAVGVEAVSIQQQLAERVQVEFDKRSRGGWAMRVIPVKYPAKMTKSERIAGLEWRFNQGRVKYPLHLRRSWPMSELYYQTENFTIDLALLEHDDPLDAVAQSQFIVRPRKQGIDTDVLDPPLDPLEMLKSGEDRLPSGDAVVTALGLRDLTPEVVELLRQRYMDERDAPRMEDDNVW